MGIVGKGSLAVDVGAGLASACGRRFVWARGWHSSAMRRGCVIWRVL